MFNKNDFIRVEVANSRANKSACDLTYVTTSKKFRVSDTFFKANDLENRGFTLYEDPANKRIVLACEKNDDAVMYRGRAGSNKSREFTSSRMRALLNRYGMEGHNEFNLESLGKDEDAGIEYFGFKPQDEKDEKGADSQEDVAFVPTGSDIDSPADEEKNEDIGAETVEATKAADTPVEGNINSEEDEFPEDDDAKTVPVKKESNIDDEFDDLLN